MVRRSRNCIPNIKNEADQRTNIKIPQIRWTIFTGSRCKRCSYRRGGGGGGVSNSTQLHIFLTRSTKVNEIGQHTQKKLMPLYPPFVIGTCICQENHLPFFPITTHLCIYVSRRTQGESSPAGLPSSRNSNIISNTSLVRAT